MNPRKYDILIPGNYSYNMILTEMQAHPELGKEVYGKEMAIVPGGVMNTVIALQRLGIHVGWLGAVGSDFFSRSMLEYANSEQIDTSLLLKQPHPLKIMTMALSYPEDRALISYTDPAPTVIELLQSQLHDNVEFGYLHFGELIIDERLPEMLKTFKQKNVIISSDCQYHEENLENPLVKKIISLLDIFIPNASEVQLLTGKDDLEQGAKALSEHVPTLIVKDGSKGSHAWYKGEHYFEKSLDIEPVDTTGSGDVFNAGFLAAYILKHDLPICLRWGNIAGGISATGYGASRAPKRDDLKQKLSEAY